MRSRARAGLTLIELLIVLAILSASSLIAVGVIAARTPGRETLRLAEIMAIDLKRARLHAELTDAAVALTGDASGYRIAALHLERVFPDGVSARWNGGEAAAIPLGAERLGAERGGATIELRKGRAAARVRIAPLTGKITTEKMAVASPAKTPSGATTP